MIGGIWVAFLLLLPLIRKGMPMYVPRQAMASWNRFIVSESGLFGSSSRRGGRGEEIDGGGGAN